MTEIFICYVIVILKILSVLTQMTRLVELLIHVISFLVGWYLLRLYLLEFNRLCLDSIPFSCRLR